MSGQYRMFYALRKPVSHFEFYAFHFTIKLSISLFLALLDYWISTFLCVSIYKCFFIYINTILEDFLCWGMSVTDIITL